MTPRPVGPLLHAALAVPTAAAVTPAIVVDWTGGSLRDATFVALTAGAALVAMALVLVIVLLWCLRRPPFHASPPEHATFASVLAGIAGLCLGGYSGVMHDVEVLGMHFSTASGYFALLPLALLVCCGRRPVWRAYLDVSLVMAGMEIGAQVSMMLTKWRELRWWDDITGIDAVYWAGGVAATTFWIFARRKGISFDEYVRIRAAVREGDTLPPRKG